MRGFSSVIEDPAHQTPMTTPSIVLIGGARLMREAMSGLLADEAGLEVWGSYGTVAGFLEERGEWAPDVIVIDSDTVPDRELLGELRATAEEAKILLLCSHASADIIRHALATRLDGVVLKSLTHAELRVVIDDVLAGHVVMPAGWQAATSPQAMLTSPRHREVLGLVAQGLRNDEIARHLGLSPSTIKFHLREVYMQLGVRNRVEATHLHARLARDAA